ISGVPEELAVTAWGGDFGALFGAAFPPPERDPRAIAARLGPGAPLESGLRSRMEGAFGHRFAGVRAHSRSAAAHLASSLNAQAFTAGENIAFAAGRYQPGTPMGEAMLAHELAHVVQQSGGGSRSWRAGAESSSLESEADLAALGALASSYRARGKTLE